MKSIVQTCPYCKKQINLEKDTNFFYNGSGFYHVDCFKSYKTKLKKGAWSIEKIDAYVEENQLCRQKEAQQIVLDNHSKEQKKSQKGTAGKSAAQRSERLRFTDWLMFQYDITFIPKYFFIKLDTVYKGTYNGLSRPCPVEDLFDMWKQKMTALNKISQKNKQKGKEIQGVQRLNYDLSIVLSKYDSYLKWKEKQQIELIQKAQPHIENHIDYEKIGGVNKDKNKENDIDILLNEI